MSLRAVLAVGIVWLVAASGTAQEDAVKKEKAKLQGSWKVVAMEDNGQKAPAAEVEKIKFIFQGDKIVVKGVNDEGKDEQADYTIDLSKQPAFLDITPTTGPQKGKTLLGIYKLDGDTLILCAGSEPGKDRPKEFATKKDSGSTLVTFKKENP